MSRMRKIPLRVCIGCQEKKPKKEMIRIVRTPEGRVDIDPTGKKAGRGAYICPNRACLHKALKGKRLEKNLEQPVSPEVLDALQETLTSWESPAGKDHP